MEIDRIVEIAKEEYQIHHISCLFYRANPGEITLGARECWSDCAECFAKDLKEKLEVQDGI